MDTSTNVAEMRRDALRYVEELYELKNQIDISDLVAPLITHKRPKFKLVCSHSHDGLTGRVNDMINEGFDIVGQHTHQKQSDNDISHSQREWSEKFCISMIKQ